MKIIRYGIFRGYARLLFRVTYLVVVCYVFTILLPVNRYSTYLADPKSHFIFLVLQPISFYFYLFNNHNNYNFGFLTVLALLLSV